MARLPSPGGDDGTWGGILNDFLTVAHEPDGALRSSIVGATQLAADAVTEDKLSSAVRSKLNAVGSDGREIELRIGATHIEWRYVGDASWTPLVALTTLTGPQGPQGSQGAVGAVGPQGDPGATGAQGPQGEKGDRGDDGGVGPAGLDGADGADGKEVELQVSATHIQWRLDTGSWTDLIALEDLRGPAGEAGSFEGTLDDIEPGTTNHHFTAADETKLDGIAAGATVNAADAVLLSRANHTGTQPASTISDFSSAADARVAAASDILRTSGDQTIGGVKTFSSAPVVPDGSFTIAKTTGLQTALDGKATIAAAVPAAGATGQLLVKTSSDDHDTAWASPGVSSVNVVAGDESRPPGAVVFWIGGTTEPVNMAEGDVWLAEAA